MFNEYLAGKNLFDILEKTRKSLIVWRESRYADERYYAHDGLDPDDFFTEEEQVIIKSVSKLIADIAELGKKVEL